MYLYLLFCTFKNSSVRLLLYSAICAILYIVVEMLQKTDKVRKLKMKIHQTVINVHQLTVEEFQALETAYKIVDHINESYGDRCRLVSPNDGECGDIDELPRVLGILSFLMENRVVDVEARFDAC